MAAPTTPPWSPVHRDGRGTGLSVPRCGRPMTKPNSSAGCTRPPTTAAATSCSTPAAFTHYSYALRDACARLSGRLIEVHISSRRPRGVPHTSVIAGVAAGIIRLRARLYVLALQAPLFARDPRPRGSGFCVLRARLTEGPADTMRSPRPDQRALLRAGSPAPTALCSCS